MKMELGLSSGGTGHHFEVRHLKKGACNWFHANRSGNFKSQKEPFPCFEFTTYTKKPGKIRPGSRKDIMLLGKWSILRWSGSVSLSKAVSLGIVGNKVWDNESETFSFLRLQIWFSSLDVPNFLHYCPIKCQIAEVPKSGYLLKPWHWMKIYKMTFPEATSVLHCPTWTPVKEDSAYI